ncbi:MAG TPA: serine/threonine-protein kinase, partial [Gemmataceae bacterium]|nr:serine/threonine-protein kinase [Gemmataceae bacterium]
MMREIKLERARSVMVQCPNAACRKKTLLAPEKDIGYTVRCKHCREEFILCAGDLVEEARGRWLAAALHGSRVGAVLAGWIGAFAQRLAGWKASLARWLGKASAPSRGPVRPDARGLTMLEDHGIGIERGGRTVLPDGRETAGSPNTPGSSSVPSSGEGGHADSQPPEPGLPRQIGRFQIRALLGGGAFGTVYRAYDPQLERLVALKVPRPGTLKNAKRIERFQREAKSAAQLRHPNIMPIYDNGHDGMHYYIASAYIEGRTLDEALEDAALTLRHRVEIVRDLAEALHYAHELKIVHRDVKSVNVMLDRKGRPFLCDFGLAHWQGAVRGLDDADTGDADDAGGNLTRAGAVMGTPGYMAPEQAAGQGGEARPVSDQYSLGVVFYELLCGQRPFSGPPTIVMYNHRHTPPPVPRSLNAQVPPDLEAVCLKALDKRPEARYANCQEVANDLRRWLEGEPVRARPLGAIQRVVRWGKRQPALAAALAVAAAAIVAVAALSIRFGIQQGRSAHKLSAALATAEDNAQQAEDNKREAIKNQARSFLDQGQMLCESGEVGQGMAWLVNGLRLAGDAGNEDLQQDARMSLAGWRRQLHALQTVEKQDEQVWAMAFAPDGKTFLMGCGNDNEPKRGEAQLCDAHTHQPILRLLHDAPVRAVAYSPGGTVLLTGSDDGTVRLWDAKTGAGLDKASGAAQVRAVGFSPDGTTLAAGCTNSMVYLYERAGGGPFDGRRITMGETYRVGAPLAHARGHQVHALAFNPRGGSLLTGSGGPFGGGVARLWDIATGQPIGRACAHYYAVRAVAFSRKGDRILTGSGSHLQGEAYLWDAQGNLLHTLTGHQAEIYAVAFSPDG